MKAPLTVHYRGPLSSCNYTCDYCPFGKEWEEPAVLEADRSGVERFVGWTSSLDRPVSILFTPWGEALVRPWYREAMVALSHTPAVRRVAAQTNLSMNLAWLQAANRDSLALWTTFHPSQTTLARFVAQTQVLDGMGFRFSVGIVGLVDNLDAAEALRRALPPHVQLWVNAVKRDPRGADPSVRARFRALDPRFDDNRVYPSLGKACAAGATHVSIDDRGEVRRCHFVNERLGNIYEDGLEAILAPRTCPNATCSCHIGYVHMKELGLYEVYGEGLMERIVAPVR